MKSFLLENDKLVSDYDLDLLVNYMDKDQDGRIGWHDFVKSMVKLHS